MLEAAPHAVELGDYDGVEFKKAHVLEHAIKGWPACFGATLTLIYILAIDFPAMELAVFSAHGDLCVDCLFFCAYSGVDCGFHFVIRYAIIIIRLQIRNVIHPATLTFPYTGWLAPESSLIVCLRRFFRLLVTFSP